MDVDMLDPLKSLGPPTILEDMLETPGPETSAGISCVAFNKGGTIMAAGTLDGKVLLFDYETRGLSRVLGIREEAGDATQKKGAGAPPSPSPSPAADSAKDQAPAPMEVDDAGAKAAEVKLEGGFGAPAANGEAKAKVNGGEAPPAKPKSSKKKAKKAKTNGCGGADAAAPSSMGIHAAPVTSITWSNDGTKLLTSCRNATDNVAILWDLEDLSAAPSGEEMPSKKIFAVGAAPSNNATPRNAAQAAGAAGAVGTEGQPLPLPASKSTSGEAAAAIVVDNAVSSSIHPVLPLFLTNHASGSPMLHFTDGKPSRPVLAKASAAVSEEAAGSSVSGDGEGPFVASFIQRGKTIAIGNGRGEVQFMVVPASPEDPLRVLRAWSKVGNATAVFGVTENFSGSLVAVNCEAKKGSDRSGFVRVLKLKDAKSSSRTVQEADPSLPSPPPSSSSGELGLEMLGDFHNPPQLESSGDSIHWPCFSWDNGFMVGAAGSRAHVFMWNLETLQVDSVLDMRQTCKVVWHMAWCPYKALLVCVGDSGKAYVWTKKYMENWSSFAPGFRELEANEEYVEKEDEFDDGPAGNEGSGTGNGTGTGNGSGGGKKAAVETNERYSDAPVDIVGGKRRGSREETLLGLSVFVEQEKAKENANTTTDAKTTPIAA